MIDCLTTVATQGFGHGSPALWTRGMLCLRLVAWKSSARHAKLDAAAQRTYVVPIGGAKCEMMSTGGLVNFGGAGADGH